MNMKQAYRVAQHSFCVVNDRDDSLWEKMENQYNPFVDQSAQAPIFTLTLSDKIPNLEAATCIYKDTKSNRAEVKIDVYKTDSGYIFVLQSHFDDNNSSFLELSNDYKEAKLVLNGNEKERFSALNTALILCFTLASSQMQTLLVHASAIINDGKCYIFLGRSGTGKSTHSKLWLEHITGSQLLNDDHPIIRVNARGEAIAYGSPWSGKTHCYRNLSAPLGGIVRIKRASKNKISTLNPILAYASLMTSCSGMSWDEKQADGKNSALQAVLRTVKVYTLECLPDQEAANVCASKVKKAPICNE